MPTNITQLDQVLGKTLQNALESKNPFGAYGGGGSTVDMVTGIGRQARTAQDNPTDAKTSTGNKINNEKTKTGAGPTGGGGNPVGPIGVDNGQGIQHPY